MTAVENKEKYNIVVILLFILLILPFMSILGIKNAISPLAYQTWQVFSLAIFAFIIFIRAKEIKINIGVVLFTLFQTVFLLSSTLNNGVSLGITVVSLMAILIFAMLQSDYYREFMMAVSIIAVASVIINVPSLIKNFSEQNAEFFIGGKNSFSIFIIPGIFIMLLNSLEKNKKITVFSVLMTIFSLFTVFLGGSTTGIIVSICTVLLLLLAIKFRPNKTVYLAVILIIYVLLIVFTEFLLNTDLMTELLTNLGKNNTLTSRTTIWEISKEQIKNNWLFGSGRGSVIGFKNKWGSYVEYTEAHNIILEILMCGGVVAFVLFFVLIFKAVKKLNIKNEKHKIIFIALCATLINGLTESTINNFMFIFILAIACRYAFSDIKHRTQNIIDDNYTITDLIE